MQIERYEGRISLSGLPKRSWLPQGKTFWVACQGVFEAMGLLSKIASVVLVILFIGDFADGIQTTGELVPLLFTAASILSVVWCARFVAYSKRQQRRA